MSVESTRRRRLGWRCALFGNLVAYWMPSPIGEIAEPDRCIRCIAVSSENRGKMFRRNGLQKIMPLQKTLHRCIEGG
jgi:hypothetical protein